MGSGDEEILKDVRKTLEPYIRPREEVARVRQILRAHLDSCLKDAATVGPLALVDAKGTNSSSTARGLQREYLEALKANIKACNEFTACCQERRRPEAEAGIPDDHEADRVQEHIAAICLRKKHERLQAVEKALSLLRQKPAASPDFLDPSEIFRDSRPLPDVPKELVTSLTIDKTSPGSHLKDLIDQLEKQVLQAKLLLRREEQLLEKVKSRSTARPENISQSAKLEALNRTRSELINWIEAELRRAAGDDVDAEASDSQKHLAPTDTVRMEEQLASVKEKYAQYLEARKALLQRVSQRAKPVLRPPTTEDKKPPAPTTSKPPTPIAHLLSPYLQQLLSVAREQKGLIAQKSHLNATIAKQLKQNGQVLDHLAEESQLIPSHAMPGAPRASPTLADALAATESSDLSSRVKPWVFAADSAKISTLEVVAEKIEEGQIALESSMRTLGEVGQLLGQQPGDQEDDEEVATEEDLWLAEGRASGKTAGSRKHTSRKADKSAHTRTAWDVLDGNLGLLRSGKDPT
ncbi:hypothetical protein VTK56DRAFT_294 [Thermocarpiscus australiensis]